MAGAAQPGLDGQPTRVANGARGGQLRAQRRGQFLDGGMLAASLIAAAYADDSLR